MATLLIDKLIEATLTITNTTQYDVLILPEAKGIATNGRVISYYGHHAVNQIVDLESYSLALG